MRKTSGALGGAWLAWEAQQVIALRLFKISLGGPAAAREAHRMVSEKVQAAHDAARLVLTSSLRGEADGGADKVVRMLRRRVRANRKRLTGLG